MKKYLFIILVPFIMTIGLTGCYTELLTTNATLASDNSDNTTIIYYPVPIEDPVPVHPHPGHPYPIHSQPVYSPAIPPNNPGNKGDSKRSETTLRNDNGGRGSVPRNDLTPPTRTRTEPSGSSNNSNANNIASSNSGNNSASRTGNTNNNSPRNNNGSRNNNGGR